MRVKKKEILKNDLTATAKWLVIFHKKDKRIHSKLENKNKGNMNPYSSVPKK